MIYSGDAANTAPVSFSMRGGLYAFGVFQLSWMERKDGVEDIQAAVTSETPRLDSLARGSSIANV
jgi:hypothetical protein